MSEDRRVVIWQVYGMAEGAVFATLDRGDVVGMTDDVTLLVHPWIAVVVLAHVRDADEECVRHIRFLNCPALGRRCDRAGTPAAIPQACAVDCVCDAAQRRQEEVSVIAAAPGSSRSC